MHNYAHCIINICTACVKIDSGTGGLIGHLKHNNRDRFNALTGIILANQDSPIVVSSNKGVFVSQHLSDLRDEYKPKTIHQFFLNKLSTVHIRDMFKARATWYAIDQTASFTSFDKHLFRAMFAPLHADAENTTTSTNSNTIYEQVYTYGVMAKVVLTFEMGARRRCWKSDH